jgi:hypothetical protein
MKITKCDEETNILFGKVTNRATGPQPVTHDDSEDVSGVTYVELLGLMGRS